jgi:exodeoxyribonuclease V gamma subunit
LVWPLFRVTQAALDEEWLAPLAVHLRPPAGTRRFPRLQQLARLYSRYATYRPQLLIDWLDGSDRGGEAAPWQPELLRRLATEVGVPNPAQRLGPACERLRDDPTLVDLPQRLSVFGLTRLPQAHLQVLEALAAARDVHLMTLHPSPALWKTRASRNRLLASWGRESAAMGELLGQHHSTHHPLAEIHAERLLGRIQDDIREDRPVAGGPLAGDDDRRLALQQADDSIRIHACHGRARQVEVIREAVLHRLQDDPTLEPRDVIVMCPNVEEFAPLIEAAFEGGTLPVRIADRSLRETNPVLSVISRLLEFPSGRVTASEVLDLADSDPVRRRFNLRDDDLAQLRAWVAEAEIHWGLSAPGREQFKLTEIDAGTWATGLRRLLLAVALDADEGLYGGALPTGEVDSGTITLAGRVAELAGRLQAAVKTLSGPQSVPDWAQALSAAADALTDTSPEQAWQRRELDRLLDDVTAGAARGADAAAASEAPGVPQLTLAEMRALLGDRLAGRPTRANFRTGQLTVCTLSPMRSVPHRVVCLLGLDDGVFPRAGRRDGDDVLAADPHPGDRDPRSEDRQLLLDALLAAEDAMIITYTGNDERTNAPRPPAVPVGELLDTIDATAYCPQADATAGDGSSAEALARDQVVVHHPLQSFDPRNFVSGDGSLARDGEPWSFDEIALEGAAALSNERLPEPAFLPTPLPPAPASGILTLDDLVRFAERPVRAFLRQRLEITMNRSDDEVRDAIPVELDPLQKWAVGQRLLEALIAGVSGRDACLAEIARGSLPPGQMARAVINAVFPQAERLALAAAAFGGAGDPRSLETNVTLDDGTRLTGTVSGVRGNVLLNVSYSRLNPRHRIAAWTRLLALTAAHPDIPFEAVTVARARGGGQAAVEVARIPTLGGDRETRAATARAELQTLVELRNAGMREPLPLPPESTFAYAQARLSGENPAAAALKIWHDDWGRFGRIEGEREKDEHPLVLGAELDLVRLAELAPRLWQSLLARELLERA